MRSGSTAFFQRWSDPTFQPIGVDRPNAVVTCQPDWFLTPQAAGLGSWPGSKKPIRWYQKADNSQQEYAIPNVGQIAIDRSIDQDAATCTITLTNQWMKTNFAAALSNELGMPGHFTHNRGDSSEARTRWNHQTNEWRGRLVPGSLLRSYIGYGGHGKTLAQAVADRDLWLAGVWLVDDVTIGATSKRIELRCRDMAALLIDQVIYPPFIPHGIYPLNYQRWAVQTLEPNAMPKAPGTQVMTSLRATFSDSSLDRIYPTEAPGARILDGGYRTSGHMGKHALDTDHSSFWWSEGFASPTAPYATAFWQCDASNQLISEIEVTGWRGPYVMYVSVMEDAVWRGSKKVPHNPEQLLAANPFAIDTEADIPYVVQVSTKADAKVTVKLNRVYQAEQIRLSFRNLSNSNVGTYKYRAGLRTVRVRGLVASATDPTQSVEPYWLGADAMLDRRDRENRLGYWTISHLGQIDAFGDARFPPKSGGSTTSGRYRCITANRNGDGFWTLTEEGRIVSYGKAKHFGDPRTTYGFRQSRSAPTYDICVDMAITPSGNGYWCLTSNGTVYRFGDATGYGNVPVPGFSGVRAISIEAHPTAMGYWAMDTNGRVTARGAATSFGNFTEVSLNDTWPNYPNGQPEIARKLRCTWAGNGYWILTTSGRVQARGAAVDHGQLANPAEELAITSWNMLLPSPTDNGYGLMRGDGTIVAFGDFVNFGSPNTGVTIRLPGNYLDYSSIVKDLLLWAGWWLKEEIGPTGKPAVYGNIESTGIYSPDPLPPEMFDKVAPLDPIKKLKEIVGFIFHIDDEGASRFTSPNWWQSGNWLDTGEHTNYIPEIDERVQLTDYTAKFSRDKDRSEIIISNNEPTAGFKDTVTTRYKPSNSLLRGMVRPAMIRVPPQVSKGEQKVMAELVGLHLWFARRVGQITILGCPTLQIDDQVRLWERVTADTFLHYLRGVSHNLDLETGTFTTTLQTNWLGTENGTWAIRAADATGTGGLIGSLNQPATSEQFVVSAELAAFMAEHTERTYIDQVAVARSEDVDATPAPAGSG